MGPKSQAAFFRLTVFFAFLAFFAAFWAARYASILLGGMAGCGHGGLQLGRGDLEFLRPVADLIGLAQRDPALVGGAVLLELDVGLDLLGGVADLLDGVFQLGRRHFELLRPIGDFVFLGERNQGAIGSAPLCLVVGHASLLPWTASSLACNRIWKARRGARGNCAAGTFCTDVSEGCAARPGRAPERAFYCAWGCFRVFVSLARP
jgi:hypothetical protein